VPAAKGKMIDINPNRVRSDKEARVAGIDVSTLPATTRARVQTYAGAAALKAYRYPKGVSGNPSGMNRYYFECRKLAKEASPEIMRIDSPRSDRRRRAGEVGRLCCSS